MMKTVCVFDDLIELLDRGLNKNLLRRSDTLAAKISKWPKKSTRREPSRACDAEKGFKVRSKGSRDTSHVAGAIRNESLQMGVASVVLCN